jgi:hypothetical protein
MLTLLNAPSGLGALAPESASLPFDFQLSGVCTKRVHEGNCKSDESRESSSSGQPTTSPLNVNAESNGLLGMEKMNSSRRKSCASYTLELSGRASLARSSYIRASLTPAGPALFSAPPAAASFFISPRPTCSCSCIRSPSRESPKKSRRTYCRARAKQVDLERPDEVAKGEGAGEAPAQHAELPRSPITFAKLQPPRPSSRPASKPAPHLSAPLASSH